MKTIVKEKVTVKDLIEQLKRFPEDTRVRQVTDGMFDSLTLSVDTDQTGDKALFIGRPFDESSDVIFTDDEFYEDELIEGNHTTICEVCNKLKLQDDCEYVNCSIPGCDDEELLVCSSCLEDFHGRNL